MALGGVEVGEPKAQGEGSRRNVVRKKKNESLRLLLQQGETKMIPNTTRGNT